MYGMASLSGGIFYHYLGVRYASKLWRPTRDFISARLRDFAISKKILLVGPSAGYLLDTKILKLASQVSCVDIDPLSPLLIRWRHGRYIKCHTQDVFSLDRQKLNIHATESFLKTHPDSKIVFCNILGQLPFLYPLTWKNSVALDLWKKEFHQLLYNKNIFSFHDRLTLTGPRPLFQDLINIKYPLSNEDLIARVENLKGEVVIDHETKDIIVGSNCSYTLWSMTPTEHHILECTSKT